MRRMAARPSAEPRELIAIRVAPAAVKALLLKATDSGLAGPSPDQPRPQTPRVTGEQGKSEHPAGRDDEAVCGISMEGRWQRGRLRRDRGRDRHQAYRPGVSCRIQPLRQRNAENHAAA